jgi:hypothetical protein
MKMIHYVTNQRITYTTRARIAMKIRVPATRLLKGATMRERTKEIVVQTSMTLTQ